MKTLTTTHLEALKTALLKLDATGPKGFEGLLAAVLTQVCEQPFRLASSGSQRGRDGDSAFDSGATYFEGKLYEGAVPKNDVAVKLMYLKADNQGQVDTWILGTTSAIGALNAETFADAAAADGIGLVLLDWSEITLPPLATVVAMAGETAKSFFRANLSDPAITAVRDGAIAAIDHLAGLPDFAPLAISLKDTLRSPSVGLGLAKSANRRWLTSVFSDRVSARQHFGQPLAPRDTEGLGVQPRVKLMEALRAAFYGAPSEHVFAVIGEEGAGKSWLVADSWLNIQSASLLLVATADELKNPTDLHGLEDFLVQTAIRQTGTDISPANQARWRRRFAGWRANSGPDNVRVTLWIDGLNQVPDFPWPRWIDAASLFLRSLGGQLILTTRSIHFAKLRNALASKIQRIIVSDWTSDELSAILKARGIDANVLSAEVFSTLKNPRVLGIAVQLLDAHEIESIQELSVGRLLFEHVRLSDRVGTTPLTAAEFAKALQELARDIVGRIEAKQLDDLRLVDIRLDDRIRAVSSSRFFQSVGDDPDLYEIRDEGLQFALALWLVSRLEIEVRNGRDPSVQLGAIIEPIGALDMTAGVVASAVEVACLRDSCPVEVASALIRHYVGLQNIPNVRRDAFSALAKRASEAFVRAAKAAAASDDHVSHAQLITQALLQNRDDPKVWEAIASNVSKWLCAYSLSPDRMSLSRMSGDPQEKVMAERTKRQAEIERRVHDLSETERRFLADHLWQAEEGSLENLHRLSFVLLAGMPLGGFAESLVSWAFSNALNSSVNAPSREFQHLVRFNSVDWSKARKSLLEQLQLLEGESQSSVGAWATVGVLRATGELSDGARAERLVGELTKDRERIGPWRLIEKYCSTDPCDPSTSCPDNIKNTVERYQGVDQTKLMLGLWRSSEDHFFEMATPGLARFEPEETIQVIERFAKEALSRTGLPRRQAVLALLPHSALLERSTIDAFVRAAQSSMSIPSGAAPDERDDWLTAQYSMFLALPHLSAEEQLAAIGALQGSSLLLDMMDIIKPAHDDFIEACLIRAQECDDDDMKIRILGALNHSGGSLSDRSKEIVAEFMSSLNKGVRVQALGVAASIKNSTLTQRIVESGWDASLLNPDQDQFEIWYGSSILISAVRAGLLPMSEALDRISLTHYGFAASTLGPEAASAVADRVSVSLQKVINLSDIPDLPAIEHRVPTKADVRPPHMYLIDEDAPADTKSALERISESAEESEARQRRAEAAYGRFSKKLTDAEARIVLADLSFGGVTAIIQAKPDVVGTWYSLIMSANSQIKRALHMFSLRLGSALAERNPKEAISLVRALFGVEPFVRHVVGLAKIPVEAIAVWSNGTVPDFKIECLRRLDAASNDAEIAMEVLAAFWAGRSDIILEYVDGLLASGEPARICRALTATGFSDRNDHADAVLARYQGTAGFIGSAARAAQYAYERNAWARHWYQGMTAAVEPREFWRCSVLLTKIVDGRFALWVAHDNTESDVYRRFFPTVKGKIVGRIKKWQDRRRSKLFGEDSPQGVFLQ